MSERYRIVEGALLDETCSFTLQDFCHVCGVEQELVREMVEEGQLYGALKANSKPGLAAFGIYAACIASFFFVAVAIVVPHAFSATMISRPAPNRIPRRSRSARYSLWAFISASRGGASAGGWSVLVMIQR